MNEKVKELYKSDAFLYHDLIITSKDYNPTNDTTLRYIDIWQDSLGKPIDINVRIFASIESSQGFTNNYIIGEIADYIIPGDSVGIILVRYFKDKPSEVLYLRKHFDEIDPTLNGEQAQYGVNIDMYEGED